MYVLAPWIESISICLRCQWRLLERRKLLLRRTSSPTLLQQRRYAAGPSTVLSRKKDVEYNQKDDEFLGESFDESQSYRFGPPNDRKTDRDIIIKHLNLAQRRIPLGINSLGEPAQIRVLRDKPEKRKRAQDAAVKPVEDVDQNLAVEELLEMNSSNESFSSMNEAFENLDNIREASFGSKKINVTPNASQCLQVGQQIHDGFTTPQLRAYFVSFDQSKSSQPPKLDDLDTIYKTVPFKRSRWFQGASEFPEMAVERLGSRFKARPKDNVLIGPRNVTQDGSVKQTKKQALVEKILRDCWSIRTAEEKQSNGEVDVQIRSEHLQLLLKHNESTLKRLSEHYGVRIDVSPSHNIIRIAGDYITCHDVSLKLHSDVKDIYCEEFAVARTAKEPKEEPISDLWEALKTEPYLQQIEEFTGTVISLPASKNKKALAKIRVFCLGHDLSGMEDARRLIIQTLELFNDRGSHVQCAPVTTKLYPRPIKMEKSSGLDFLERFTTWARWSHVLEDNPQNPRSPEVVYNPQKTPSVPKIAFAHLAQAWRDVKTVQAPKGPGNYWEPRLTKRLIAIVGYIVHAGKHESKIMKALSTTRRHSQALPEKFEEALNHIIDRRRTLITKVPAILPTLENLISVTPDTVNQLRISLRPSGIFGKKSTDPQNLPNLELRIGLDEKERQFRLASASLIRKTFTSDLLLPTEAADLRFHAQSAVPGLNDTNPAITKFIEESNLNVWGDERLRTPARMRLAIPLHACSLPNDVSLTSGEGGHTVEVEYHFSKLEHWSSMRMMYQGFPLTYSTVEGGKTGGRREELRLTTALFPVEEKSGEKDEFEAELFMQWFVVARELVARIAK